MKYLLLFIAFLINSNLYSQSNEIVSYLTQNTNQCETYTKIYKNNLYIVDCYYNQWIFSLSNDYIPLNYDSLYMYKNHLIFKTHIKNFPIGCHSYYKCPYCLSHKYIYNIKELSELSPYQETYIKKCEFKKHSIFRVGTSANYWSFHNPNCLKCKNQ